MSGQTIGISDMSVYIPANRMDVETIVRMRSAATPALAPHFERAVATTAQRSIRFPSPWEDTATMAAEAAYALMKGNPRCDPAEVRFLTVGTETTVDHSKPASSYVQGMLQQAGFPLCHALSSFQVQHACASGTLAMLSVGALLLVAGEGRHAGLVICSDIACYDARTTAEVTQGAGSVALLVEPSPRLLELNLGTLGFCSKDVDDFFRPLGSRSPKVKGGYSVQCYTESLELAFRDHCRRRKEDPAAVLESTDLFVLHTPFHNMPEYAMIRLLKSVLGLGPEAAREYLRSRGFYAGTAPVARIGNIYSGSLYLCLSFLLAERFQALGEEMVGKSVLLASYGSGNTMAVFSGTVAADAPSVLSRWSTERHLESGRPATWEEYEEWMRKGYVECDANAGRCSEHLDGGSFHLARLREDGYRLYGFRASEEGSEVGSRGELAEPASVV
jgi:hydroxymethylglutaryl-CoA synthase